jgi:hypothetical protein
VGPWQDGFKTSSLLAENVGTHDRAYVDKKTSVAVHTVGKKGTGTVPTVGKKDTSTLV